MPEPAFPDGVYFVQLTPVGEVDRIAPVIAEALNFPLAGSETDPRTPERQVLDFLQHKQMLLVLDNFDHLLEAGAFVSAIIRQAPAVQILSTSRERLSLKGEQVFPLHGLPVPDEGVPLKGEKIPFASAQLFLNIARRVQPDFEMTDDDANQLVRICQLVDGMPLGIELAASWVSVLSLADIAREIEQSLSFLAADFRDVPPRHQSMQAALETSWRHLGQEEKQAFQRLSVFRGGFTRAAAFEVADADLGLLVRLTNKSWLSYDHECDRYHIHELLRQYGDSKLSANPEREIEARELHSAYFCKYLQTRENAFFSPRQEFIVSELRKENDNVHLAWNWALKAGSPHLIEQGVDCLGRFYEWEGRWSDGQTACRKAGNRLHEVTTHQLFSEMEMLRLRARILVWEARFTSEISAREALLGKSQELLGQVAQKGHEPGATQTFLMLQQGWAKFRTDYEAAKKLFKRAIPLIQDGGSPWDEAEALGGLGLMLTFLGDWERADRLIHESYTIYQKIGDRLNATIMLSRLGLVARYQGRLAEAERHHTRCLELFSEQGSKRFKLLTSSILSYTQSYVGKFMTARETARYGVTLSNELGRMYFGYPMSALALAAIHRGSYEEARAHAQEGLEASRRQGDWFYIALNLQCLGGVALAEREFNRASDFLQESVDTFRNIKHIYDTVPMAFLAYVSHAIEDRKQASQELAEVLLRTIENRNFHPVVNCLPIAALLAADRGDVERAAELQARAWSYPYISNSRWFADIAGRELGRAIASLPPEVASAAKARGQELDLWTTAEKLLEENTSAY
jgi:tetratricopeptide (TPR) repeat protein